MFSHVVLGARDIEESRKFYDAIVTALGGSAGTIDPKGRLVYSKDGGRLLITIPIDGKEATHANGGTVGFKADTPELVDAWHAAGLANGGTAIESPPGIRQNGTRRIHLAYLRDPVGNKLCAGCVVSA
jgi:catechol 2,3-dioxygenase-like lactoylglutathione lyase family enzyme